MYQDKNRWEVSVSEVTAFINVTISGIARSGIDLGSKSNTGKLVAPA